MSLKFERLEKIDEPKMDEFVRLKETGNIIEIMSYEHRSKGGYIEKINKDFFIDKRTGEVREFVHNENRSCDLHNVAKSLAYGRDILNVNIVDVACCRWVTLTYGENVRDTKKIFFDFKNFNKRLRKQYGHYEYIVAVEPQGRGAWHLHAVLIFDCKAPYIPNDDIWCCWSPKGFKQRKIDGIGYDFTKVKKLDNVDNVGAYLTAYLGDLELNEAINLRETN